MVDEPIRSRKVVPDPSIAAALGRQHSLETAVADVIDNSIDADADTIEVRIELDGGIPLAVQIIDNGRGMNSVDVDAAMTYAHRRDYSEKDLGHFGIGLKAASLSQAEELLVWSKKDGCTPIGRRLRRESVSTTPVVEEYAESAVLSRLTELDPPQPFHNGTIIEWRGLRKALTTGKQTDLSSWISRTVDGLHLHLGLVFHRHIKRGLTIVIVQREGLSVGAASRVQGLDPFPAARQADLESPCNLVARLHDQELHWTGHIWRKTARAATGYRLGGRTPMESQGLYIYRHDRLLQAGGWANLADRSTDLQFARMSIDIDGLEGHVELNPEKSDVTFDAMIVESLTKSMSQDGRTFAGYLDGAKGTAQQARTRQRSRINLVEPRGGVPSEVREALRANVDFVHAPPFDIVWSWMPGDEVFRVDLDRRMLFLNSDYRSELGGDRSRAADDAPVTKALLTVLVGEDFDKDHVGPAMKHKHEVIQSVLRAAVRAITSDQGDAA